MRDIDPGFELVELPFDFAIALSDLGLVKLVKLQSLAKGKKMFAPVVSFQATRDFLSTS